MEINLKVTENKLYSYFVELLNPLLKLPERERKVLGSLLLLYYKNKNNIDIEEKILGVKAKRTIAASLEISEASMNNSISILRKKGCIKGKVLNKDLIKFPENNKLKVHYTLTLI